MKTKSRTLSFILRGAFTTIYNIFVVSSGSWMKTLAYLDCCITYYVRSFSGSTRINSLFQVICVSPNSLHVRLANDPQWTRTHTTGVFCIQGGPQGPCSATIIYLFVCLFACRFTWSKTFKQGCFLNHWTPNTLNRHVYTYSIARTGI